MAALCWCFAFHWGQRIVPLPSRAEGELFEVREALGRNESALAAADSSGRIGRLLVACSPVELGCFHRTPGRQ